MADTSSIDLGTVLRALEDEGVLKVRTETRNGNTYTRRTFDRTIRCLPSFNDQTKPLREQRIVLRLAALFGEADNPAPGGWPTPGPQPGDDPPPPDGTRSRPAEHGPGTPAATPTDPATPPTARESSMQHTNAGGLTLSTIMHEQTRACVRCGIRCAIELGGLALHPTCFWATTAATVAELHAHGPSAARRQQAGTAQHSTPRGRAAPTLTPEPDQADERPPGELDPPRAPVHRRGGGRRRGHGVAAGRDVAPARGADHPPGPARAARVGTCTWGWRRWAGRPTRSRAPSCRPEPCGSSWGYRSGQLPKLPSRRGEWLTEMSTGLGALHEAVALGWVFGRGEGDPMLKATTKLRRRDAQRGSVQILMTAGISRGMGAGGAGGRPRRSLGGCSCTPTRWASGSAGRRSTPGWTCSRPPRPARCVRRCGRWTGATSRPRANATWKPTSTGPDRHFPRARHAVAGLLRPGPVLPGHLVLVVRRGRRTRTPRRASRSSTPAKPAGGASPSRTTPSTGTVNTCPTRTCSTRTAPPLGSNGGSPPRRWSSPSATWTRRWTSWRRGRGPKNAPSGPSTGCTNGSGRPWRRWRPSTTRTLSGRGAGQDHLQAAQRVLHLRPGRRREIGSASAVLVPRDDRQGTGGDPAPDPDHRAKQRAGRPR